LSGRALPKHCRSVSCSRVGRPCLSKRVALTTAWPELGTLEDLPAPRARSCGRGGAGHHQPEGWAGQWPRAHAPGALDVRLHAGAARAGNAGRGGLPGRPAVRSCACRVRCRVGAGRGGLPGDQRCAAGPASPPVALACPPPSQPAHHRRKFARSTRVPKGSARRPLRAPMPAKEVATRAGTQRAPRAAACII